jgi:hypothetical protein
MDYVYMTAQQVATRDYNFIKQVQGESAQVETCVNMWNKAGYLMFSNWQCANPGSTSNALVTDGCTCQAKVKDNEPANPPPTGAGWVWAWEY